jgi:hypothetical protein
MNALGKRIIALRDRVVAEFTIGNWHEVGLLTGYSAMISGHNRLLRSLSWGDEDYASHALEIITSIAQQDEDAFRIFEQFVAAGRTHCDSSKLVGSALKLDVHACSGGGIGRCRRHGSRRDGRCIRALDCGGAVRASK